MKYHAENAVSSFFYYMWNAWSKEECKIVFDGMHRHFWEKWNAQTEKSIYGAAERFYSELSENYQRLLVERAVSLYDGKAHRKQPDDSEILVCSECGSQQIEVQVWADANTDEYLSDVDNDSDGTWCAECEMHIDFCPKTEFIKKMQTWWNGCDTMTTERITELKECNADEWWENLDYDGKRNVYNKHNPDNE